MAEQSRRPKPKVEKKPKIFNISPGDKVRYQLGATINTGDFSSIRVDFGVERTLHAGQDVVDFVEELVLYVEEVVDSKVDQFKKGM